MAKRTTPSKRPQSTNSETSAKLPRQRGVNLFSEEEQAALREHAQEVKALARRGRGKGADPGEADVLAKIAAMAQPDRALAERVHAIVKTAAPTLSARTWFGMPAYSLDGNVVCFFQAAQKFKTRYATLGFSDKAKLDDGTMWPIAFALKSLTTGDETRIAALVRQATS